MESEIDFSPSIGVVGMAVPLHPVPSSSNNGTTLDWSKPSSEDEKSERRWTLSMSKRKNKDQVPILSSVAMEKQQVSYIGAPNLMELGFVAHIFRKINSITSKLTQALSLCERPRSLLNSFGEDIILFIGRWVRNLAFSI
jgi:hypothetical protein